MNKATCPYCGGQTERAGIMNKVLTLEEFRNFDIDDIGFEPAWIELQYVGVFACLLEESENYVTLIDGDDGVKRMYKSTYGRIWRRWLLCPTDEERAAAPWGK